MKIRVLGCSGAEFPGSNAPSFLVDDEIVLDAGSVTNVLDEEAQFRVRHIFITHAHLDHIRGIPFLADNIITSGRTHQVALYSLGMVTRTIRRHLFNSAVWPDFTMIPHPDKGIVKIVNLREGKAVILHNTYKITPYRVSHTVPAVGYLVEDKKGMRLFYTGDTGPTRETWKKMRDRPLDCLIIDISFPNGMEALAVRTGHLTPRLLGEELTHMPRRPDAVYVTHPKPRYIRQIDADIRGLKLDNITLLKDGDVITL
jgi:ribonuclease BN (tRNA processing enzyme)